MPAAQSLPQFVQSLHDDSLSYNEKAKSGRELIQRFTNYQFEQYENKASVDGLLKERANFVDQFIKKIWSVFIEDPDACLIAVGGYGREQLHPYSDIDLLILSNEPDKYHETYSKFITFLWDVGFEVGQSIRTIEESIVASKEDITTATNMIESRWITGNYEQYQMLQNMIRSSDFWSAKDFYLGKLEEQNQRHSRFHETTYQLEPNIKESPGGLRDIHTIYWVAKHYFQVTSLNELVQKNFITPEEATEIEAANRYLNRLRFELQYLKKRREERLQFDIQQEMAQLLGFTDTPEKMAVEQFMSRYYRNVRSVVKFNEILLQHFRELLIEDNEPEIKSINKRFYLINNSIEIVDEKILAVFPPAIFEAFLILQTHPEVIGFRSNTIRAIRNHLHLIDDDFREDPINKALFLEIFRQHRGINAAVKRLHAYGILGAYLPAFEKITGLMQFNIFHAYTVDEHTVFVIRNLRRFFVDEFAYEFPTLHQIAKSICRPEVLFLAGLFHDIAKGRQGAHEIVGAEDAKEFGLTHHLDPKDTELMWWLVRYHLEFSHVAQRKDLSDPAVIADFAELMVDQKHLDHLYLLTVADVCATSDDVWNDWKNSLFLQLYNETSKVLDSNSSVPKNRLKKALLTQEKSKEFLTNYGLQGRDYQPFWDSLQETHFFSRHNPNEVAEITDLLHQVETTETLVQVKHKTSRGASKLLIYMPDRDYLFAQITYLLDQQKMDIMESQIYSSSTGMTLVVMYFLNTIDHDPVDKEEAKSIQAYLQQHLEHENLKLHSRSTMLNRRIRCFETPTLIKFKKLNAHKTELYVETKDIPGLLSRIGYSLMKNNIRLHDARISTIGEKAEDVFVISDFDNKAVTSSEIKEMLTEDLIDTINNGFSM